MLININVSSGLPSRASRVAAEGVILLDMININGLINTSFILIKQLKLVYVTHLGQQIIKLMSLYTLICFLQNNTVLLLK